MVVSFFFVNLHKKLSIINLKYNQMKKTLLTFVTFALAIVGVKAQSWTAPELPLTTSLDNMPAKTYFYHVGQKMFLTKGTTWGTHAALTADPAAAFLYDLEDQTGGAYKLHCSLAANTGYLGRNSNRDLYTDYRTGSWGLLYEFAVNERGYITIRNAASDPYFGADVTASADVNTGIYEMGWDSSNDDLDKDNNSLGTNVGVFMLDPEAEGVELDWAFVTEEGFALYSAQYSLFDELNKAFEVGYTEAELADYASFLASDDADAVKEAATAVGQLILQYGYNHATPENPYDVSSVIVNPTIEGARNAVVAGWIDEFDNMHIQNNKDYPIWDDELNQESTEYGFKNFAQNWTSSNTEPIAESNLYQVISDLPQGTYMLQADCIATSASASLEVSGAELYANSGAVHYSMAIDKSAYGTAGGGNPHRYTLMIVHMGGDLTIGYGFKPGYVKWFGVDNFKLFYAGPVDNPGLVALTSTLAAATPYADEYETTYYYNKETNATLVAELEKANEIINEGDSDNCMAEVSVLSGILDDVKKEVAAYGNLLAFTEKVQKDQEKYAELNMTALADQLQALLENCEDNYSDLTATIEMINEWISSYDQLLLDGVKASMAGATEESPVEITALGINLDWANNNDKGWTHTDNHTTGDGFKVVAHTAEVWNAQVSCLQTIENLPAGKYIIKAKAFYRTAATDVMTLDDEVSMYLVANASAQKVVHVLTGGSEEQLYTNDVLVGEVYVPNSQAGAEIYFKDPEKYNNEVSTYLVEDGDLTFGIKNEGPVAENGWNIWGEFRIFYAGVSNNALYEESVTLAANATELNEEFNIVAQATSQLEEAIDAQTDLTETSAEEDILAVIAQLKDAISYVGESKKLVEQIMETYTSYEALAAEQESVSEGFDNLMGEIGNAVASEEYQSNEQIDGWLKALPAMWTASLMESHMGATKDAPEDVTAVLVNPSFDTLDSTGWTYTNTGGSIGGGAAQRQASTAYEAWNATAFDIHQTVVGLPAGFYHITVKALFRNGNNSDALAAATIADMEANKLMDFYANDKAVKVVSPYEEGQTIDVDPVAEGQGTYIFESKTYYTANTLVSFKALADNEELNRYSNELYVEVAEGEDLTIGLRYEGAAGYAWAPFDDFKIEFLGAGEENRPDAVETVVAAPAAKSAAIFDLSGRRVAKAVKGIYIINGVKVVK